MNQFPEVKFIKEHDTLSQLDQIITCSSKYFAFMVDDMLFFDEFNLREILDTLSNSSNSFSFHLKLSPNIRYSHTNDKAIAVPSSYMIYGEYLKYKREDTQMDWNYPFDFCGSIYRSEHIVEIYNLMKV